MAHWIYLAVAILAEVLATSALKLSDGYTRLLPSVLSVAGYVLAFYMLALAVRVVPVGLAYAIWAGVGIVLVALIGWLFLGQSLDLPALLGIALILAGVLVISLASGSTPH